MWRRSVGDKGVNRITVYERPDATSIHVEWWDNEGRHREALRRATGEPVTDRKLALKLASIMAEAQKKRRNQSVKQMLGIKEKRRGEAGSVVSRTAR